MIKPKIKYLVFSERLEVEGITSEQAADAYSEMIDALIDARTDLVEWNKSYGRNLDTESIIDTIEKALKKAGVKL